MRFPSERKSRRICPVIFHCIEKAPSLTPSNAMRRSGARNYTSLRAALAAFSSIEALTGS